MCHCSNGDCVIMRLLRNGEVDVNATEKALTFIIFQRVNKTIHTNSVLFQYALNRLSLFTMACEKR